MENLKSDASYIIIGGGGHAKVLVTTLRSIGVYVLGFLDVSQDSVLSNIGVEYLGKDYQHKDLAAYMFANGIGSVANTSKRSKIFDSYRTLGCEFPVIVHRNAYVEHNVNLDEGVQIMMGALVQTGVSIGANSIINTGASIDHDCSIGAHAHIAPGATLSGNVQIGDYVHIGTNATIIQGIKVGKGALIGAGSVVTKDISPNAIVMGNPAKLKGVR